MRVARVLKRRMDTKKAHLPHCKAANSKKLVGIYFANTWHTPRQLVAYSLIGFLAHPPELKAIGLIVDRRFIL